VRRRIHMLYVETVSLMISESAATKFSVMISKLTATMCPDKSTRQLWKYFR
jgi:hypothetical protein